MIWSPNDRSTVARLVCAGLGVGQIVNGHGHTGIDVGARMRIILSRGGEWWAHWTDGWHLAIPAQKRVTGRGCNAMTANAILQAVLDEFEKLNDQPVGRRYTQEEIDAAALYWALPADVRAATAQVIADKAGR